MVLGIVANKTKDNGGKYREDLFTWASKNNNLDVGVSKRDRIKISSSSYSPITPLKSNSGRSSGMDKFGESLLMDNLSVKKLRNHAGAIHKNRRNFIVGSVLLFGYIICRLIWG